MLRSSLSLILIAISALVTPLRPAFAQAPEGTGSLAVTIRQAGEAETTGGPYYVVVVPANEPDLLNRPDQKDGLLATNIEGRLVKEGLPPGDYIIAPLIPLAETSELASLSDFTVTFEQGPLPLKGTVISIETGKTTTLTFTRRENPKTDVTPPDTGDGSSRGGGVDADEHSSLADGGEHTAWGALLYSGLALIAGSSAAVVTLVARRRIGA
jgi:hypothetical protein